MLLKKDVHVLSFSFYKFELENIILQVSKTTLVYHKRGGATLPNLIHLLIVTNTPS